MKETSNLVKMVLFNVKFPIGSIWLEIGLSEWRQTLDRRNLGTFINLQTNRFSCRRWNKITKKFHSVQLNTLMSLNLQNKISTANFVV